MAKPFDQTADKGPTDYLGWHRVQAGVGRWQQLVVAGSEAEAWRLLRRVTGGAGSYFVTLAGVDPNKTKGRKKTG